MIVIVEGPDGGGKSVLASFLSRALNLRLQASEGRPKYPGEFIERVDKYMRMEDVIFDRHPVISQGIYGLMRGTSTTDLPTDAMINELYRQQPLMIYCRATDLTRHEIKAYDTAEHLASINKHAETILEAYDRWAVRHAHLIYRIGDKTKQLALEFARDWEHR